MWNALATLNWTLSETDNWSNLIISDICPTQPLANIWLDNMQKPMFIGLLGKLQIFWNFSVWGERYSFYAKWLECNVRLKSCNVRKDEYQKLKKKT